MSGSDFDNPSIYDGLPMPPGVVIGQGIPAPLEPVTPENLKCLQGPCQYYWEIRTSIDHGNAEGTFEALDINEPELYTRRCVIQSGVDWDLAETNIYACNRWAPMRKNELMQLRVRREEYFADHPEHRETDV